RHRKPIPLPVQRLDDRLLLVAERVAQARQGFCEHGVAENSSRPTRLRKLLLANDLAGTIQQKEQNFKRLLVDLDEFAVDAQLGPALVERGGTEEKATRRWRCVIHAASSCSSAFASFKSGVSKPSVNQL